MSHNFIILYNFIHNVASTFIPTSNPEIPVRQLNQIHNRSRTGIRHAQLAVLYHLLYLRAG